MSDTLMKAVVISKFGPAEVMQWSDVPRPVPGDGEVLIRVHAVSVNRTLDISVREGNYPLKPALPHILGVDPSGEIAEIGPGVTTRAVGDRVAVSPMVAMAKANEPPRMLGVNVPGGYAEYVKVPASITYIVPDALDFARATVVSRHVPTALHLLRDRAKVAEGEWVLVLGAAGGLGAAGIQVAKMLGARVIAGCGSARRVEAAMELGADAGLDYGSEDLAAEVMRITGGAGANVVFANMGNPDLFSASIDAMARFGRLISAGAHGGGVVNLDMQKLYLRQLQIIGATGQKPEDVNLGLEYAATKGLKMLIDRVLPLEKAIEAHRIVENRGELGKIILSPVMT
tara:strand:+ start:39495 stop:40523 length:1029 start_codon:yes stop_codon:yes gene_type:complete